MIDPHPVPPTITNLVFEGGSVKSVAYCSALCELTDAMSALDFRA